MVEIFTVASPDSIGNVRTLFESVHHYHPDLLTTFVVADSEHKQWSGLDLGQEPYDRIIFAADAADDSKLEPKSLFSLKECEFTMLAKPIYAQERLQTSDCDVLLYLSPSSVVFSPLDNILKDVEQASISLAPQVLYPESTPDDDLALQVDVLRHGIFGSGFVGLTPTAQALNFVEWWQSRLLEIQFGPHAGNLLDSQWLDLAPALFENLRIERRPGCNVSKQNYLERALTGSFDEGFSVGAEPLIHGDFEHSFPTSISTADPGRNRHHLSYQVLLQWYRSRIRQNSPVAAPSWSMSCFENGTPIREEYRSLYRTRQDLQQAFPNPFRTDDPSFLRWLQTEWQSADRNVTG